MAFLLAAAASSAAGAPTEQWGDGHPGRVEEEPSRYSMASIVDLGCIELLACVAGIAGDGAAPGVTHGIRPLDWHTWWFWGAVCLIAAGGGAGIAWWAANVRRERHANEQLRSVVEAAPTAMIVVNPKSRISMLNSRAEREFGYTRGALVNRPVQVLVPDGLGDACGGCERGAHAAHPPRSNGQPYGVRSDGSRFPIEIVLASVQTTPKTSTVASITDVSERKRIELELAVHRNQLAHLSRVTMLGELSGSLAHELNQPLTAILSNAQAAQRHLAREQVDLDEIREILGDIVEQDKRAGEVIKRLRALLHKGEAQHQVLSIGDVVLDVLRLMRSDLINHGVGVRSSLDPEASAISGDRVQLQQVLMNLLINACDAMSAIPREVRSLEVRVGMDEDRVRVSVIDAGAGFLPELGERLFEPFFTTKSTGMGLGLAVCRTIVQSHGGEIRAEHNPSGGAIFSFSLPAIPRGNMA